VKRSRGWDWVNISQADQEVNVSFEFSKFVQWARQTAQNQVSSGDMALPQSSSSPPRAYALRSTRSWERSVGNACFQASVKGRVLQYPESVQALSAPSPFAQTRGYSFRRLEASSDPFAHFHAGLRSSVFSANSPGLRVKRALNHTTRFT
jgi:hypothetical protein